MTVLGNIFLDLNVSASDILKNLTFRFWWYLKKILLKTSRFGVKVLEAKILKKKTIFIKY